MAANVQPWENAQQIASILPQGTASTQSGIGEAVLPTGKPKDKPLFDWSDPNTKLALISAALSALQPVQGGQSPLGHVAQALNQGLGFLQKGNIAKKKGDIEEGKLDVSKRGATTAEKSQMANQKYMEKLASAKNKDNIFSDEEMTKIAFDMATAEYKADSMVMGPEELQIKYQGGIAAYALRTRKKLQNKDMTLEELRENWLKMQGTEAAGEVTPVTAPGTQVTSPESLPSLDEALTAVQGEATIADIKAQTEEAATDINSFLQRAAATQAGASTDAQGFPITPVENVEEEIRTRWESMDTAQRKQALKILKTK